MPSRKIVLDSEVEELSYLVDMGEITPEEADERMRVILEWYDMEQEAAYDYWKEEG